MSGYAFDAFSRLDAEAITKEGFLFLHKPFSMTELLEAIETSLSNKEAHGP